MQNRDQFYPDIETKYDHLLTHMTDKNRMSEELIKIMKEVCNMEDFYSSSMDKFANSVSKLLIGKDPIKDILIIYERILATKSEESQKFANSIKNDILPFLEESLDLKAQKQLRDTQKEVRQMRMKMQKKLRGLYNSEKNFKISINQMKNIPKLTQKSEKQRLEDQFRKRQLHFNEAIDSFNGTLDQYMVKYAQICEQLSQIETKRKYHLRDTIRKLIIIEMDSIKNIQYNLARYMENLDKMEGRLLIQERIMTGGQPFYDRSQTSGVIQLAKLSNKNYIDHCIGKKNLQKVLSPEEINFREIRTSNPAGLCLSDRFDQITKDLFKILDFSQEQLDPFLLKQVVSYSKDIFMDFEGIKMSLLQNILCHPIFSIQKIWVIYGKALFEKMARQQGYIAGDMTEKKRPLKNLIESDLAMLKSIQINHYITNLIRDLQSKVQSPGEEEQLSQLPQRIIQRPVMSENLVFLC